MPQKVTSDQAAVGTDRSFDSEVVTSPHVPAALAETLTVHAGKSEGPAAVTPRPAELTIRRELGRGGMGVVYEANDPTLDREVALKVLSPEKSNPSTRQRFVREARITAKLPHPGVPPVHTLGEMPDGSPYLAMKVIRGRTLAEMLPGERAREGGTTNLIQIFEKIAQTVGFAHSRRIIHRDLKPQNVMVGEFGEVQVMDWGLAKELDSGSTQLHVSGPELIEQSLPDSATDTAEQTSAGIVLGTPAYMPPEQARGEAVDERADVFALGAILCEMLTGSRPWGTGNGPTLVARSARGDISATLETIDGCGADEALIRLAKQCLAPVAADRPANGKAVADALADYQRNVDSRLRRAEADWRVAQTRAAEFRKRRQVWIGLAAALLVGTVAASVLAVRANKARTDAESAKVEAENQKTIAVGKEIEAKEAQALAETNKEAADAERTKALNFAMKAKTEAERAMAVREFLQRRLLMQADPLTQADDLRRNSDAISKLSKNPTIRELLDRAAKQTTPENLERDFPAMPLVQAEILYSIGATYVAVGEVNAGVDHLTRACDLMVNTLGRDHLDTMQIHERLAFAYLVQGKRREAVETMKFVRDVVVNKRGTEHKNWLAIMNNLAVAYDLYGDYASSLEIHQRITDELVQTRGNDTLPTLTSRFNLAMAHKRTGDVANSVKMLESVCAETEKFLGADHPGVLTFQNGLGEAYSMAGKPRDAERVHQKVLVNRTKLFGPEHPDTLITRSNLAQTLADLGKLPEAIRMAEEVRIAREKVLGKEHPDTVMTWYVLGKMHTTMQRFDEAKKCLEQACELGESAFGEDHPDRLKALNALAGAYMDTNDLPAAIRTYELTRTLKTRRLGADHPSTVVTMNDMAIAYFQAGRIDECAKLIETVLEINEKRFGPKHPETLTNVDNLGVIRNKMGKTEEAIRHGERALSGREAAFGLKHPQTVESMNNLAQSYFQGGRRNDAHALMEKAADTSRQMFGNENPRTMTMVRNQLKLLDLDNQHKRASDVRQKLLDRQRVARPGGSPAIADTLSQLARSLMADGRPAEAEKALRECLEIREKDVLPSVGLFVTRSELGEALLAQKKYGDAKSLLVEGYEGIKDRQAKIAPAQRKPVLLAAIDRLIRLADETKAIDDRKQWETEKAMIEK